MAGLVGAYIDAGEGRRSAATNGDYRRALKAAVLGSPIGPQPSQQLARAELRAFLEGIARRTPIRANRVLALVRAAFRWGLREELIERDPTAGLQRLRPERPRERVLADQEIRTLWITLDELAASDADPVLEDGKMVPRLVVASAVKLLLLLGTRRSETLNMRWVDVDERAKTWTVPGMFRKGGRTHVVPLPPLALGVLKDLRPVTGKAPWVFVGKRGASLANNPGRFADFIRETAGLDFKLHDLRRTCATGCARLGASESTVSRILGHKAIAGTIAVSGIYDRVDRLPEIRARPDGLVELRRGADPREGRAERSRRAQARGGGRVTRRRDAGRPTPRTQRRRRRAIGPVRDLPRLSTVLSLIAERQAMAQLVVRKLESKVVMELRKRAARSGRSMEAEHREILRAALLPARGTKSLKELLLMMPAVGEDSDFARPKSRPRRVRL